jgi:hypothetical protein
LSDIDHRLWNLAEHIGSITVPPLAVSGDRECRAPALSVELTMDKFVHDENLKIFHKRLMETINEKQRQVLHDLIAEHETKYREWKLKPKHE